MENNNDFNKLNEWLENNAPEGDSPSSTAFEMLSNVVAELESLQVTYDSDRVIDMSNYAIGIMDTVNSIYDTISTEIDERTEN